MLSQLYIENIALIDKLELELKSGLNILSGETGAGKSIIIDSLNFVLGERADKSLIRHGTDMATVQAVFEDYLDDNIAAYLDDVGIQPEEVLILKRKMSVDGKNECRINGRVTTISTLKGLTELLVDIHGQHEHQSLLKSSNHIGLLDSLGVSGLAEAKADFKKLYDELSECKRSLQKYGDEAERERRLDLLNYQLDEIKAVDVQEGEEEALLVQRKRIRNMEKILSAIDGARAQLDGPAGGVGACIKSASSLLDGVSAYDDGIPELVDRLDSAKAEIKDIVDTLSDMLESLDFDSRSAEQVEQRLEDVRKLLRKYGGSYEQMAALFEKMSEEAEALSGAEELVAELEARRSSLCKKIEVAAEKLTELRQKTANNFQDNITRELNDLGMGGSTFKVDIKTALDVDDMTENGADRVEFLISPNKGEPLKPLAKIISGGEMSRFMLALKNILACVDGIGTLVFDEIDTGISGNISAVVSEKMCNISRSRQVIAVTHMPSLAAMADNHYLISKSVEGGKTLTHVTLLSDDTDEVARLIGGNEYSKYAVPHAGEMKAWAERYKQSLSAKK